MARTPWREALDAKVRLIRYMQTSEFKNVHASLGMDDEYINHMDEYIRMRLPDSDPIWVDRKIGSGILNNLCDEDTVFDMEDLSIPNSGVVWLQDPLCVMLNGQVASDKMSAPMLGFSYSIEHRQPDDDTDTDEQVPETYMMITGWQLSSDMHISPVLIRPVDNDTNIAEWIIERAVQLEEDVEARGDIINQDMLEAVRNLYGRVLRYMYTLFSFMQQRIIMHHSETVDRAARRDAERNNVWPEVRVLRWRLKKYERMETHHVNIDWSCRWPVRSHTRHYADGTSTTIPSYIKGPRDKPLKPATPRIHVVDR